MLFTYLPTCCVLCGLKTFEPHQLCCACFNDCRVYAQDSPHAYPRICSLFPYTAPYDRLITKLKFNHELTYAKALGLLLVYRVRATWYKDVQLPQRLIPVPLHAKRLRERGFNQALEIGRHVEQALAIPLDLHTVTRIKPTLAQSGLSKSLRQKNIQDAFASNMRLDGLHVAIIDDVITTGQTVLELSKVLKNCGAAQIDVWCCARA